MTTTQPMKLAVLVAAMMALASSHAADKLSKDEYKAEKAKIEANYKTDKAACDGQQGNAKDVCEKEATAKEKVALADLDFKNTGKDSDRVKVEKVKAEQDYAVAKEKCEDMKGAEESACKKQAKAAEAKAKADIKAEKKVAASS